MERVARVTGAGPANVAINAHHHGEQIAEHIDGRAHVSMEQPEALGTAGAVAQLRPWLDGRAALIVNADTWTTIPLELLLHGWDGTRVRVLVAGAPTLAPGTGIVASALPPDVVATLPTEPSGLYEVCWKPLLAEGRVEVIGADGPFIACDRPRDYLAANLATSGGDSVIGDGAVVRGVVTRSVVWPGAVVGAGEGLIDAIRTTEGVTVLVR